MNSSTILENVRSYYTEKLAAHGPTPSGVDWNSPESQSLRFDQLVKVCDFGGPVSIIDYGAGYGALVEHLSGFGPPFTYVGFDISETMVAAASERYGHFAHCRFTSDPSRLEAADYVLASGIFNVRLATPRDEWEEYVLATIARLDALGSRGFAFNVLTSYSDADRMRPDLYYADPCFLFDHCKRRFSRNVALLHDYGLYEFTVLVRK